MEGTADFADFAWPAADDQKAPEETAAVPEARPLWSGVSWLSSRGLGAGNTFRRRDTGEEVAMIPRAFLQFA